MATIRPRAAWRDEPPDVWDEARAQWRRHHRERASGQLIFATMRSSARDACAGLSIASGPTPATDGAPAYLEEVLPAK